MLGKLFGALSLLSIVFAFINGQTAELGNALLDGAESAVQITLSLCGMTCFWGGVMEVLSEAQHSRQIASSQSLQASNRI